MMSRRRMIGLLGAGLLTVAAALPAQSGLIRKAVKGKQKQEQPHMRAALEELEDARELLEDARGDKGGHGKDAIRLVKEAREQLRKGIRYDNSTDRGERRRGSVFTRIGDLKGRRGEASTKMTRARDAMQNALRHLDRASDDKGAHKTAAQRLIRQAIASVNKGVARSRR